MGRYPPPPADRQYLKDTFSSTGLFAKAFDGYELRRPQIALAKAVHQAFRAGENLLAEGPCGTGKSMAYLVPAVEHAKGGPVLIVTANIALQEQLAFKDLPLLQKVLGRPLRFALIKGKSNYLCQTRFKEWGGDTQLYKMDDEEDKLKEWAEETETGDITEFGRFIDGAVDRRLWSRVCGDRDECSDCKETSCFSAQAREKAVQAQIIVCNYHVLFAHIELHKKTFGKAGLLPELNLVICDEGHEMADVARDFAQIQLSEGAIRTLATKKLENLNVEVHDTLIAECDDFFRRVREYATSDSYNHILSDGEWTDSEGLLKAILAAVEVWEKFQASGNCNKSDSRRARKRIVRGKLAAERLLEVTSLVDENFVYWIENAEDHKEAIRIKGKPKNVSEYLKANLFGPARSVVVTSATLTTNGDFKYARRELGIEGPHIVVKSPFNFDEQALFVVPRMSSIPGQREFADDMAEELAQLLEDSQGRALGLFTSSKNMRAVYERMPTDFPFQILMQGDKPRMQLLEEFLADTTSVLFGTKSFWTGVDIPGESLTLLFIDKIPFPPPSDPVIAAIEQNGGSPFWTHSVPQAIIALRQGHGRLIRSLEDVGVVVLFDQRILQRSYGANMIRSLGDPRVERNPDKVYRFLEKKGALLSNQQLADLQDINAPIPF